MSQDTRQFLTFHLDGEFLAVPVEQVREIIEFTPPTPVPGLPPFMRGLINLRGTVVPVIDLQARLGKVPTEIHRRTCIVVVELQDDEEKSELGMLVHSVNEVLTLDSSHVEPAPSFGIDMPPEFVSGILNLDHRFVIALDLRSTLSIDELSLLIDSSQAIPEH